MPSPWRSFIEAHNAVTRTFYPFLDSFPQRDLALRQMATGGTLVAFDLGSKAAAFAFLNALQIVDISNNLGDAKSLVTHPATTTHRTLPEADRAIAGITPGLVRLSVGLEKPEGSVPRHRPGARRRPRRGLKEEGT